MARGSASKLDLDPGEYHKLAEQTTEIKRMLTALIQKLNAES